MPLAHGARPFPGIQGFPPNMMGGDGFPMPDLFGMAPRGFGRYGPRFSGELMGPGSGMMFPGRPSGGFGMMMGPGRPPFMGAGAATPAGAGRPVGMPPFFPPPSQPSQNFNRPKRDQKVLSGGYRNDRFNSGSDAGLIGGSNDEAPNQPRGKAQSEDHYGAGNDFGKDESESEDEAPRRSRHGEGKKKRHSMEGTSEAPQRKLDLDVLTPFEKNFYVESPSVGAMSESEVEEYRWCWEITVERNNVPKPMKAFQDVGFPRITWHSFLFMHRVFFYV
ncbi:30-kDa cleavage and polyadenylation specificity factor 30-like [Forsythia ovata]|uniref:30-kDa cleavage and polyadenylation specificity factor 30-like n=1 Tax=Forsythia ovata TaxID=205694 RepID=A0ABD1QFP4_9LAMI